MGLVKHKQEIQECPGPQGEGCRFKGAADSSDLRVKGYDQVWRCIHCTRVHNELVFESIQPDPDAKKRLQDQVRHGGGYMAIGGKDE